MDPRVVCWVLVFQFPMRSEHKRVPESVTELGPPPPPNGTRTAHHETRGRKIVSAEPDCSYTRLVEQLLALGFKVTRACKEEATRRRTDDKPESVMVVRFYLHQTTEKVVGEAVFQRALQDCVAAAGWMTTVWDNPYYRDEEEVPDQRCMSVNAAGPQWLFELSGQPVMVWPDQKTKREGGQKVARQPACSLTVEGSTLRVVKG